MSKNWSADINAMHKKFGIGKVTAKLDEENLYRYLTFRFDFLQEELNEGYAALESRDPEEVVDALIDLCVVALGTLDAYKVSPTKAWNAVLSANMKKKVGIKASRPNPYGLPDLIKPEGWKAPSHAKNHGLIAKAMGFKG